MGELWNAVGAHVDAVCGMAGNRKLSRKGSLVVDDPDASVRPLFTRGVYFGGDFVVLLLSGGRLPWNSKAGGIGEKASGNRFVFLILHWVRHRSERNENETATSD